MIRPISEGYVFVFALGIPYITRTHTHSHIHTRSHLILNCISGHSLFLWHLILQRRSPPRNQVQLFWAQNSALFFDLPFRQSFAPPFFYCLAPSCFISVSFAFLIVLFTQTTVLIWRPGLYSCMSWL